MADPVRSLSSHLSSPGPFLLGSGGLTTPSHILASGEVAGSCSLLVPESGGRIVPIPES